MISIQTLTALDTLAFNWCQTHRRMYSGLSLMSLWVSRLGDGLLYLCLGVSLAIFEQLDGLEFFQTGLLAFCFELPLYILLKNCIRRDRPCHRLSVEAVIKPSDQFSFPSGHAAAAFLFVTVLAQFYPAVAVLGYCLAAAIGISRVLLGVHYPSDIVAGAAVGVICAELALWVRLI